MEVLNWCGGTILKEDGNSLEGLAVTESNKVPLTFLSESSEWEVDVLVVVISGNIVGSEMVISITLPESECSVSDCAIVSSWITVTHSGHDVPRITLACWLHDWVQGGVAEPEGITVLGSVRRHGVITGLPNLLDERCGGSVGRRVALLV